MIEQSFDSHEALDRQLAADIAQSLAEAIARRGEATLVVSGGSTPAGVFARLSRELLDWQQVTVLLADDRWVPADHEDSNEGMVHRLLLTGEAAAANYISLLTPDADPADAEAVVSQRLAGLGPFDVMMLGMGGDGHFASLFPQSEAVGEAMNPDSDRLCIAVTPPAAPHRRMSLTLARILDCRRLILHITGEDKLAVLSRAERDGDAATLPIAAVLASRIPEVETYWAP